MPQNTPGDISAQGAGRNHMPAPPIRSWRRTFCKIADCRGGRILPLRRGESKAGLVRQDYFKELLTDANMPLRLVPRPFTTAMIASAMPAAIRPYSIAVAPESLDKNFNNLCFTFTSV